MKKLLLFAALSAALTLLFACTKEVKLQTETWKDHTEAPLGQGIDASFNYSASVEYLSGGVSKPILEKINAIIVERVFFDEGSDVPAAGAVARDRAVENYKNEVQDFLDLSENPSENSWMYNWSSDVEGVFGSACKERSLQTYVVSGSDYQGGAHGMFGTACYVIDMNTGALVEEKDLFADGYESTLAELLFKHRMDDMEEATDLADPEDIFYAEIGPNNNFSVDEKGVTYYYSPYEIAPYVFGVITIPVPWEELKPILRQP